eukprot:13391675-Heterocapsa_arctica.AAC.1
MKTATDKRNISQSSGSIDRFLKSRAPEDNPEADLIPNSIPTLGSAIPGVESIPPHLSGDRSGDSVIPPASITEPASGSAD